MIPKQKARELVEKMAITTSFGTNYTGGEDIPIYKNQHAKQCAVIAVDEYILWSGKNNLDYWQQVKQEIEKL